MSHLRRLLFPLLGAVVIPAVTLVTVVTVSAAAPKGQKSTASAAAAHRKPCTPFSGCSQPVVKSSAIFSLPSARSHSHCSRGHKAPRASAPTERYA
jgi:hypothetical protein